ncbi:MAG: sortase domain-containing protein [Rubrobacteraceae bacterium]
MKYKKRRQQAGFTVFVSLVILILSGLMFFGVNPAERLAGERESGGDLVQRPETPTVARAPEAVEDVKAEEEASDEPAVVRVPDIPYNATEQEAEEMLENNGLELGEVKREPNDDYDKDGVFLQDPLPDVEVEEGSSVGITLSSGPEESADEEDAPDPGTTDLYLTVPKMGLYGDYIANATDEGTLMNGAGKITETGFPWQPNANTYIASHVYGYQGTGSWQHFAALPTVTYGDEVILSDANGTEYFYEVTNIMTVMPTETWVTEPVAGKNMVSLQTCVGPGWSERMVVQAERVGVNIA